MRRRTPTQTERIARRLRRFGKVSPIDFEAPTVDLLPPVRRVASRIQDLRDAGWIINTRRANGMALYVLVQAPSRVTGGDPVAPPESDALALLDVQPEPLAPANAITGMDS